MARALLTSLDQSRAWCHLWLHEVEELLQPESAPLSRVVQAYSATLGLLHNFTFSHLAFSTEANINDIQRRTQAVQRHVLRLRGLMTDLQRLALNMPDASTHGLLRIFCAAEDACLGGAAILACAGAALLYRQRMVAGLTTLLPAAALGTYGISAKLKGRSTPKLTAHLVGYSSLQERYEAARCQAGKVKVLKDALFECASGMLQVCDAAQAVAELAASVQPSMPQREHESVVSTVLRPVYLSAQDILTRFKTQC